MTRTTHVTYRPFERGGVSADATCGRGEETKKDETFMRQWPFAHTTHVDVAPAICMRGPVREMVIYFKFHENRLRNLGAVGI